MWTAGEPAGSISAGFVRDGRPGHANGADPNPLDREVPAGDRSAAAEDRETLRAEFIAGPPIPPTAAFLPGATFAGALRDVEPLPAGRLGPPEGWQSPAAAAARWADLTGTTPGTGSAGDAAGGTTAGGGSRSAGSVADRLRGLRPGIGFTVSRELTERLVGIAAGIVAAAFLLPWGPIVIGAPSLGTPWISLGVLGSGNLVVLLLALGVVGLALAVRVVPDWLRLGVAPLALGALALGVSWPYLMGPIGGGPGVPVLAFGALVCAVVGLAGIWRAVGSDDAPSG